MNDFDPKQESKGLGDTIAKFTHATGLDKVAEATAKMAGLEDCGCNKRRRTLNEIFPYTSTSKTTGSVIPPAPLDEIAGNYLVLEEIHTTLPNIGAFTFNKGTKLLVNKDHPLYKDIPYYYEKNIVKKL
jgi:hypothetical protein